VTSSIVDLSFGTYIHNFTALVSIDSFGLAWGPDTIHKERGMRQEEGVLQARHGAPTQGLCREAEAASSPLNHT
jgi:hypothetical protein